MKSSALLPIALIVFVDVLGFTVVIPLLPFYAEHFGATPLLVGALVSSYAACALVAGPLLGRWSDRRGRKPVLLLSQCGSLAGFVMLALAPSLPWIFAARMIDGLTSSNVATARAWISDVTPPKQRSSAFGVISAAYGFGFLVGPAGAGVLARYGPQVPLWAAAGLSALSMLCTQFLLRAGSRTQHAPLPAQPPLRLLGSAQVAPRLWQLFGFLLAFSMFSAGFALFCERRLSWRGTPFGVPEVGLVLAYVGLLGLLTQFLLLRPLVRSLGEARLVRASLLGAALGYAGLCFVHELPALLLCLSLCGVANSAVRPALLGLISQQVPPQHQGLVFGFTQSLQSLAMIAGPLAAGSLIHLGWLGTWALLCAGCVTMAIPLRFRAGAAPSPTQP